MLANHEIRHISEVHDLTREQIYDIKSRFNSMCHLSSRQNVEEPGIPHEYYIANIDFMAYCLKHISERILKAAGIDISNPKVQICWQQFLELHCTFKQGRISDEYQIRLWCKFFDPKMTGLVSESKYMTLVEELIRGRISPEPTETTKLFATIYQRELKAADCLNTKGDLVTEKYRKALEDKRIDLKILTAAISNNHELPQSFLGV